MSTSSFQNPRYSSCKSSFSTPSSPASPPTSSHPQNQRPFTFLSISFFLLFFDAVLTSLIIHATSYTEIDYGTYLSQAHAADLGGERNYYNIGGPSGPCVYPAAHLYIFAIVGRATRWAGMLIEGVREREDNDGLTELRPAQYIFAVIYLATLAAVLWIYGECWSEGKKTMDGVVGIRRRSTLRRIGRLLRSICIPALTLTLSRRIHSLYVLRLFNDCIASLFFYIAVGLFVSAGKRHGDGLDRPHWNRWSRWHTGGKNERSTVRTGVVAVAAARPTRDSGDDFVSGHLCGSTTDYRSTLFAAKSHGVFKPGFSVQQGFFIQMDCQLEVPSGGYVCVSGVVCFAPFAPPLHPHSLCF
mmetsp:Transcript_29278/g.67231  ORF Transcript_29278/g.67231 Transcript_29278/m.67231 type:complete len:357 (+) Transcript_29278:137-1207(+)